MLERRFANQLIKAGSRLTLLDIVLETGNEKVISTIGPFKANFSYLETTFDADSDGVAQAIQAGEAGGGGKYLMGKDALNFLDRLSWAFEYGLVKHYNVYIGTVDNRKHCDEGGVAFTEAGVFLWGKNDDIKGTIEYCNTGKCGIKKEDCPSYIAYRLGKFDKYDVEMGPG